MHYVFPVLVDVRAVICCGHLSFLKHSVVLHRNLFIFCGGIKKLHIAKCCFLSHTACQRVNSFHPEKTEQNVNLTGSKFCRRKQDFNNAEVYSVKLESVSAFDLKNDHYWKLPIKRIPTACLKPLNVKPTEEKWCISYGDKEA